MPSFTHLRCFCLNLLLSPESAHIFTNSRTIETIDTLVSLLLYFLLLFNCNLKHMPNNPNTCSCFSVKVIKCTQIIDCKSFEKIFTFIISVKISANLKSKTHINEMFALIEYCYFNFYLLLCKK
jgi:hypothetical protein